MRNYLAVAVSVHVLVHLMLLLGANRLAGYPQRVLSCMLAAVVGGIYSGLCMMPQFRFLGNTLWRCVFLCLMGFVAYGFDRNGIKRTMLFALLSMALDGISATAGSNWSAICGGAVFCIVGYAGLRTLMDRREYVEVELRKGEKREKLLALRDTGNTLRDPVSGQSVLVADAQSAQSLLGLSGKQLRCPVETVASGAVQGLRLIPYRTVGQTCGMLVAIRLDQVRIGSWQGSAVVAFAPEGLGENCAYRALTGGVL